MESPDSPQDEASRIGALKSLNILDTLPEEKYDRITRLCCRLFDVPIALVSLVDVNRQWFKSCQGLDVSETSRDISFCGHTILGDDIFVIPDAKQDKRFADNPLVTGNPNIRFYAGYPLRLLSGSKIGTLCIIDVKPREFTQQDMQALSDLGMMIEQEINAQQMATIDELTQISNRRGFLSLGRHYLSFCSRQKMSASLVYIDIDDFKLINDSYGHAEGDFALKAFAEQMQNTFRQTDLLARLSGDEFVILLSNTEKKSAVKKMNGFCKMLDYYNQQAKRGYDLSITFGIVEFDPDNYKGIEFLISDGDCLMYENKKLKKSQETSCW